MKLDCMFHKSRRMMVFSQVAVDWTATFVCEDDSS